MSISYEKLKNGGYKRHRGKTWTCPKCGQKNENQSIDPRSGRVQKCSQCNWPKPMIFGVKVCVSCKHSDQVDVLPSFVHICPNCASTELEIFPPITDEALREGIHPKYAPLKWRCKCGNDNPYPYANCLVCGLSIDEGLNELSEDKKEAADEIAKKMRVSNWRCPYCGRINKGTDEICPGCGNSGKKPEDDIIRKIRPDLFSNEVSEPTQERSRNHDQSAKQGNNHEMPERKKFEFPSGILEKGERLLGGVISIAQKVWWVIPIILIIILIMGSYKEEEFLISDMKYDSTYIVEKYTTVHHTNETTYPVGAYNIIESQKSRYVPDEDDNDNNIWNSSDNYNGGSNWSSGWDSDDDWGSNWGSGWDSDDDGGSNWGSGWDSDDDWSSDWGSGWDSDDDWGSDWGSGWDSDNDWGSDWGSDWNDYGGDYFDNINHIIQRLRKLFHIHTQKILTRIEYYNVYEYDVDEWVYSGTINYTGGKEKIKNPESELTDNERIASSSTTYTLYLKKEGYENIYSIKVTEKEWQEYNVGDTIIAKTLFGHPQFIKH